MKLFLDDLRPCPEGWVYCRWPVEVIRLLILAPDNVIHVSLDHDLGDADAAKAEGRKEITGNDVVLWIEERVHTDPTFNPPRLTIHSDNGPGIDRMRQGLQSINRVLESRKET